MNNIKRYCKFLLLKPDPELMVKYKAVHAKGAAWPEITQGMIDVGILDMEIYLSDYRLFMIMDTVSGFDHVKDMEILATKPRQAEWEAYVSKFQQSSAAASAAEKWQLAERISGMEKNSGSATGGQLKTGKNSRFRYCFINETITKQEIKSGIPVVSPQNLNPEIEDFEFYQFGNFNLCILDTNLEKQFPSAALQNLNDILFKPGAVEAANPFSWKLMERMYKMGE